MIRNGLFSSESVSEGHPDKLADRISDAILDEFLRHDPDAQVACETLVSDQLVVVVGEYHTIGMEFSTVQATAEQIVRKVLRDTGYRNNFIGIDPAFCQVEIRLSSPPGDIAQACDPLASTAADQGVVFGFACNETAQLMPAPIAYAHQLMRLHSALMKSGTLPWLRPDAKSHVTYRYQDGRPVAVEAIAFTTQHADTISTKEMNAAVREYIINPLLPPSMRASHCRVVINPFGRFVIAGPKFGNGMTGRKLNVDTYGGAAPHGGGAFSGNDPSKFERCGAYMARFLAKQVVARGWATRCLTQISYAVDLEKPINLGVDVGGTGSLSDEAIAARLLEEFDLRPAAIVERLDLKQPIYYDTAAYGHFGRDEFSWEKITDVKSVQTLQPARDATRKKRAGRS